MPPIVFTVVQLSRSTILAANFNCSFFNSTKSMGHLFLNSTISYQRSGLFINLSTIYYFIVTFIKEEQFDLPMSLLEDRLLRIIELRQAGKDNEAIARSLKIPAAMVQKYEQG